MTQSCRDQRNLYRQQYRQGQMFRSRDLSDQVEDEEQLRWWHNRAVHHAYGIANGCEAKKTSDGKAILVKAGLAYDSFGRSLWFNSPVTVPVPVDLRNQEGTYVLFICKFQQNRDGGDHHLHGAWCEGILVNDLPTAEFAWKPAREFSIRDGVAIATVNLQSGGVIERLAHAYEYRTRSDRNPYLINGQTILGHTAWEVWKELPPENRGVWFGAWGVQVMIDTRAAGFMGEPIYVAQTTPFVGPFLSYVTNVSEEGFTFRIVADYHKRRVANESREQIFLESPQGLEWLSRLRRLVAVKWIGLESMEEMIERTR